MLVPIYSCQLIRSDRTKYDARTKITGSDTAKRIVGDLVRPILENSPTEQFVVITCDTKLKPIGVHPITAGTLDASLVHPREVFRAAMLANASSIFVCHNHPSGDLMPSAQDLSITDRLERVGSELGIEVNDHIIVGVGDNGWDAYSLKAGE